MIQDDYGDNRHWHNGVDSIEMECYDCEEPMKEIDRDLTAQLVVYQCPCCEDKKRITVRGIK